MRQPRKTHIYEIEFLEIAILKCFPAHVLPNQVDGCSSVKKNGSEGSYCCSEGCCHICCLLGSRINAHSLDCTDCKRNTYVADRTNISRNGSTRSYQCDVDNLNRCTYDDARLHVSENQTYNKSCYERTTQCVVSECRASKTRHTGKTCTDTKNDCLNKINLHKSIPAFQKIFYFLKSRTLESKLSTKLRPVSDCFLFQQCKFYTVSLLHDCLESLCLFLSD